MSAHFVILLLLALMPLGVRAESGTGRMDVYGGISVHTLANGLTLVLAPSGNARNIEVELQVHSGWGDEDRSSLGVAHLVEHLVFRDDRLESDQSYLELIKEYAGGSANGVTT